MRLSLHQPLRVAAAWPLHECLVTQGWQEGRAKHLIRSIFDRLLDRIALQNSLIPQPKCVAPEPGWVGYD